MFIPARFNAAAHPAQEVRQPGPDVEPSRGTACSPVQTHAGDRLRTAGAVAQQHAKCKLMSEICFKNSFNNQHSQKSNEFLLSL